MMTVAKTKADWVRETLVRYEGPLLRYAASITGDAERARDVVQEAFVKLCEADRDHVADHLAAWLYTVVRNLALNVRKKEARMAPLMERQAERLANGAASPRATAEQAETRHLIATAIHKLPEDEQEVCRLKFQDGLTYREIGQVMGVSLGTVSNILARALGAIREQLRASGALQQEG